MKKIPSLYMRERSSPGIQTIVRPEVTPGCEWVLAGEGVATRKFDGTCCRVLQGKLWKRYDVKKDRKPPEGFEPAQEPDLVTGHWPGWIPVGDGPEDRWFREAVVLAPPGPVPDGTYELCGPKINGNPEGFAKHALVPHGQELLGAIPSCPPAVAFGFHGVLEASFRAGGYLNDIEGIVWHHQDGVRACKIKVKDFGYERSKTPWPCAAVAARRAEGHDDVAPLQVVAGLVPDVTSPVRDPEWPSESELLVEIRGQRKLLDAMQKIRGPQMAADRERLELTLYAHTLDFIVLGALVGDAAREAATIVRPRSS